MSATQGVRRFVLTPAMLLALLVLTLLAASATARAEEPKGYGELTRFAGIGDAKGQLDELRTRAIGVDPTDNSVYLVDEPKSPNVRGGFLVREIRVQKFKPAGEGKYAVSASATFTESSPPYGKGHEVPPVEGIAVDPAAKRLYVLVADIREKALTQDKEVFGGGELFAASTVYAFSTQESGEALIGAGSEGTGNAILAGPAVLRAQSNTPGAAILQPRGITVEPATGDVIIFGHVDPSSNTADNLSKDHYATQRLHSDGALGSTYTDSTDVLKKELGSAFSPSSPVVVESEGKAHVEVLYGGLVEIPSSGAPTRIGLAPESGVAQGITGSASGGRLSASTDGTVWGATGSIKNDTGTGEPVTGGLVAFSGLSGSELGWTGGQTSVEPARTLDKCVIEPYEKGELAHLVAAGSGGKVFAFAPEYLLREIEGEPEIVINPETGEEEEIPTFEKLPGPFFPAVIELGPGGTGCPGASAGPPVARVSGVELKGEEPARPGTAVAFSSAVKQADALKVEWDFGDGTAKQVLTTDQFQSTHGEHKFDKEGKYTITETIYSDNLAAPAATVYAAGHFTNPTITVTRTLTVSRPHPKPEFSIEPATVGIGQAAAFGGEAPDANGAEALPLEYSWDFGDGSQSGPAATRTASHSYAAAGTYSVTLTVTDHLGLKGTIAHEITVSAPPPPPPPPPPPTGSTTAPAPPPPPPGGTGGVLSYKVSLARTSLSVTSKGAVAIAVQCLGASSCTGGLTLRTLTAVSARAHKQILLLGSVSFPTIAAGQSKSVTLHLSAKALKFLVRSHTLRAQATILAKSSNGETHTSQIVVTLRAPKHR
jgi:PKD repeat protein